MRCQDMHFKNNNVSLQSRSKQQGLALVTVLFIFALASMLAISIQQRQSLDIAQTASTLALTQAQAYALSAEDIVKAALVLDMTRDHDQGEIWDTASELWNQDMPVELGNAKVLTSIRDLQGLFNLNALQSTEAKAKQRFQSLLNELGIENGSSIVSELSLRLSSESSPYDTAGAGILLTHPSELLMLESVDLANYKKLEPYVTALPVSTSLNINTAPGEVLASFDNELPTSDANSVVNQSHAGSCGLDVRNDNVFKSVDEFWDNPKIKPLTTKNPDNWDKADFTVFTQYFAVLIQVHFDEQVLMLESIIRREKDNFVGVVYRDFSRTQDDMSLKIIKCGTYPS